MRQAPAPDQVRRFRDIIARRLGLAFDDGKLGFLTDVLWRRLDARGQRGADYLAELDLGASAAELDDLAPELTVAETYFFRNIDQFRAFSERVMPERMEARSASRTLRVLSAGCATGEEPYTVAILLRDRALDPSWTVSIQAVDLNGAVIERARRGVFTPWALRETPPAARARWFHPRGRELHLDPTIRDQVGFSQSNLIDDDPALWAPRRYDVVFCRNVLMYFVPRAAQAIVDRIARALVPGGFLFLGHAETLRGVSSAFRLCHTHDTFYYQRRTDDEVAAAAPGEALGDGAERGRTIEPAALLAGSWVDAIGHASDRIHWLSREHGEAAERPIARPWDLASPIELLRQERYGEALGLVAALPPESARDPDVRLLEAVLLAHGGRLDEAQAACQALLGLDELNAGAHYVLALCREGRGDRAGALEHDEIAAHLDPAFAMPRLHLGLLARRSGERDAARHQLGLALDLLKREDSSRLLLFGGGFGRDALIALCRDALLASGGHA